MPLAMATPSVGDASRLDCPAAASSALSWASDCTPGCASLASALVAVSCAAAPGFAVPFGSCCPSGAGSGSAEDGCSVEGFESPPAATAAAADFQFLPKPAKEALSAPAGRSGQESLQGLHSLSDQHFECMSCLISGNQR